MKRLVTIVVLIAIYGVAGALGITLRGYRHQRHADQITIRVYGLVNDIVLENLGGEQWRITERVLELQFERPGDEFYTSLDKFKFLGQKWVTEVKEVKLSAKTDEE